MSTIKSSAEDLTINADGSNEIKFQINAVEKASINSSGLLTSTTIDATALTGALPALDGSSLTGISGGDLTPSFGVELSSHQSIPNATETKIAFDTEVWDTDSAFDNSSNYRFTVPSGEGGKYLFSYGGSMALTQDQIFQIQLEKNGSNVQKSRVRDFGMSTQTVAIRGSYMMDLSAGDYIELYVYQSKGSAGDLFNHIGTHFSGFKLLGV